MGGVQVYNLGNGRPITLKSFISLVSNVAAPADGLRINYMPDQPGDVKRTCANISKARAMLGYDPKTPFEQGLKETFAWFQSRRRDADMDTKDIKSTLTCSLSTTPKTNMKLRVVYDDEEGTSTDSSTDMEGDDVLRSLSGAGNFDFMISNKRSTSAPAGSRPPRFVRNAPKRR